MMGKSNTKPQIPPIKIPNNNEALTVSDLQKGETLTNQFQSIADYITSYKESKILKTKLIIIRITKKTINNYKVNCFLTNNNYRRS